jgi:hypothetical protein
MPGSWDPQVYRERARQWRDAAAALRPGETRDACIKLSEGYQNLAKLIALDKSDATQQLEPGGDPTGRPPRRRTKCAGR